MANLMLAILIQARYQAAVGLGIPRIAGFGGQSAIEVALEPVLR